MGSGGGSTQMTSRDMPGWAKPYAEKALQQGWGNMWRNPQNPYPQQQIAPLNDYQNQGLQMAANRAMNGSPVTQAMQTNLTDTLNGKYLDPSTNPAWQPMVSRLQDAYQQGTAAQLDAAAARANAFGNSGYNQQMFNNQRAFGDSLMQGAGDLYNAERGRQMQANLFAPQAAQADYADAQALLGVGDTQRQYAQDLLNAQYQNAYQQANWPYQRAQQMLQLVNDATGGMSLGTTTSPNPYQTNKTATALGGSLAGAGLGAMLAGGGGAAGGAAAGAAAGTAGFPVFGTLIGAAAGGLLGALS